MAILAEKLKVEVVADTDQATRAMGDLEDKGSRMPGWAKAAGAALAGVAVAGGALAVGFGKAINAGSDLNEQVSKGAVVFGDSAGMVTSYAQQMADAFGLPKTQILEATSGFGLLGKASGLAGAPLADFSTGMAQAAADASSFYNVPMEDALAAIKSGLVGEAEPLRAYGVLLNDAAVQQEAMALGIWNGTGAMSEAQKVQARQSLIMKGLADANGDLARTQESVSNQTRELQGRFANLTADIGTALLPAAGQVLTWANDAVGMLGSKLPAAITWLTEGVGTLGTAFRAGFAAMQEGDVTSDGLVGVFETVGDAIHTVWGIVGPILSSWGDTLREAFGAFTEGVGPVGGLISSLQPLLGMLPQLLGLFSPFGLILKALQPILPQLAGAVGQLVGALAGALVPILTTLLPVIAQVAQVLIGALSGAFAALLPAVVSLVPMVAQLVGILGDVLLTVVQALTPLILMLADVLAQLLPALMPLVSAVLEVVGALLPLVAVAGDLIGAILPPLVDLLMALLEPILALIPPLIAALVPALLSVAQMVTDFLVPAVTFLADLLGKLVAAIAPVVAAILGGLVKALGGLIQWVVNTAASIVTFVADALGGLGRFASGAGEKVGEVVGWFAALPGRIMGAISGLWQMLYDAGANIIKGLAAGIGSAVGTAVKAVSGVLDKVRDFLPFSPAKKGPFSGKGWTLYSGQSITSALADGMTDNLRQLERASNAVAAAAVPNLAGPSLGAQGLSTGVPGQPGYVPATSGADALGVGATAGYGGPSTLVFVDADGNLIGRMRAEAGKVATGQVTPLDDGKASW